MKRTILTLTLVLGSSICTQSFGFDLLDRMLGVKGCGSNACCDIGCAEPTCGCEAPCEIACEPTCGAESKGCGLLDKLGGGCLEPTCGCEAPACGCAELACEPTCGCEAPCEVACEPTCGCEAPCEPECGCEVASCDSGCCGMSKRGGLLSKLFKGKLCSSHSCDSCCEMPACEPVCEPCCDSGCDSACGPKGCGLLSKLFGNICKKSSSCCDMGCDSGCSSCGCGAPQAAPMPYSAPVQSAPVEYSAPMPPAPVVDPSASLTTKRRVIQASASYVR